ncbi:C40 family peptidase [Salinimicrobium tongyeongense]|uniref:C40 family peptidase n=1 Tax=Salinimicrobium tongyeongense TaxID=2809707 RepID=A0ABY6NMZ0_9FLAO|nr:C40 family peptidase [Salinimicrobium tongyeongense]UZH54232.1 C40 family peptidase [Salinimicrobium tongyeongense]
MKLLRFTLLALILTLTSCGARKSALGNKATIEEQKIDYAQIPDFYDTSEEVMEEAEEETFSIIDYALQFLGTKYKYGGTTPQGMDCSGLVYTCFLENNIELPRSSRDMALLGDELELRHVKLGDLLFFKTDRRKKAINHVGLVVELDQDNIFFIHSSSSRGVIISALNENYWKEHFVMARRIL